MKDRVADYVGAALILLLVLAVILAVVWLGDGDSQDTPVDFVPLTPLESSSSSAPPSTTTSTTTTTVTTTTLAVAEVPEPQNQEPEFTG